MNLIHSVSTVLSSYMIHSRVPVLSNFMIHLSVMGLLLIVIHSYMMALSVNLIHSAEIDTFLGSDSLFRIGTIACSRFIPGQWCTS